MPGSALIVLVGATLSQPNFRPPSDALPPDVALEASMEAYSNKVCADEMNVKFKAPGAGERVDTFVIRMQPGETPRSGPRRMFLDLGQLKVFADRGTLTAISTAAPGKYAQMEYTPPLTPAVLATFLPPVPLPQLALAANDPKVLRSPTPYTPDVTWSDAQPEAAGRPQTVTITGLGPAGPVTLVTSTETGRMLKFAATIRGRAGESVLELTSHPLADPGDPSAWAIKTEGRERVAAVSDLRPTAAKRESADAKSVPDLTCIRPDMSRWSLHAAMDGQPQSSMVLVLFRQTGAPERAGTVERDAKAALACIRSLRTGMPLPGESPDRREPLEFRSAAAVSIPLADFNHQLEEARRGWGVAALERSATSAPSPIGADELMGCGSAAEQWMDLLQPAAGALAVVIAADKSVQAVVKLDGRSADQAALGAELRAALIGPPATPAPK